MDHVLDLLHILLGRLLQDIKRFCGPESKDSCTLKNQVSHEIHNQVLVKSSTYNLYIMCSTEKVKPNGLFNEI